MERIRIGNDIAISWALFENNGATHLINAGGASVSLNCGGYTYLVPSFSVQGNVVSFIFPAEDQVKTGKYKIVLTERNESGLVSSYDVRDAFVLVPESEMLNVGYTQQKNVEITSVITHAAIANIKTISIVESEEEGGDNVVTFVLTDGSQFPMTVKNGSKGDKGDKGDQGIQGEKGDKGDTGARGPAGIEEAEVTVDGTTGTPAVEASIEEGVLSLAFSGLKGEKGDKGDKGNTGSSVDFPYELVTDVETDDDEKGLAASQGVVLDNKISQLGQYVDRFTFEGADDAVVRHIISGIIPNRTYRLQFDKVWDFTPSSVSTTAAIMEIVGYRNEVGTTLQSLPISKKAELLQSYDITNSGDYDYIRISIRANFGTNIDLCVSDITNESPGYVLERGKFDAGYFQLCGYIRTDGSIAGFTDGISVHGSTFIKVIPGDSFSVENPDSLLIGYASYGANKAFISTAWFGSPTEIIIPADCYYIRLMARLSNGLTPATFGTKYILLSRKSISLVKGWILTEAYTINSVTRDADGNVTSANVVWPDSKTGTLTITRNTDGNVTQEVASYNGRTYTINITRDANGNVTSSAIS